MKSQGYAQWIMASARFSDPHGQNNFFGKGTSMAKNLTKKTRKIRELPSLPYTN